MAPQRAKFRSVAYSASDLRGPVRSVGRVGFTGLGKPGGTRGAAGHFRFSRMEKIMTEKKGHGSATARKANAKASHEGKSNPRKSSSAQAELGKKGGKSK